jgi:hypothetical protein
MSLKLNSRKPSLWLGTTQNFLTSFSKFEAFKFKKTFLQCINPIKDFNYLALLIFLLGGEILFSQGGGPGCRCNNSPSGTIGITGSTTNINSYVTNPVSGGCYIVKGIVQININILISGSEFQFEEGAELRVLSAKTLTVTGSSFHGCDKLWRGLNVLSGGTLAISSTYVQDAQYAIKAAGTANIMANGNHFLYNYDGIFIPTTGGSGFNNVRFNVYSNIFDSPNTGSGAGLLRLANYSGISPDPNGRSFAGFEINYANVTIGSQVASFFGSNTIQNMRVGVYGKYSNIDCYYLTISHMIPLNSNTQYTSPEGVGILAYRTTLRCYFNSINDALAGIAGSFSWLRTIFNNDITNIDVGVIDQNSQNSATITYNDITNFRNRGVWITRQSSLTFPMIGHNLIATYGTSATSIGYQTVGILMDMVGAGAFGSVIEYNEIHVHSNALGIHNNSGYNIGTGYNEVTFDDDSETAILGIGIAHTDSRNCFIIDNTVTATEYFENITAFSSDVVPNTQYCCNHAEGIVNYGYAFSGDCRKATGFTHNETVGHTCGVWLAASSVIGAQPNMGNMWYTDTYLDSAAHSNCNPIDRAQSKFYVETCSQPLWPPSIFPYQGNCPNPGWFNPADGSSQDCGEYSSCNPLFLLPDHEISFSDIDDGDEAVARGILGTGDYGFTLDYESRRHLFERMSIDPSSHSVNGYVDSFYSATSSSNIAEFTAIAFEIDTLMSYTTAEQDTLDGIILRMNVWRDSIRKLDSLFYLAANATDSSNVIAYRDTAFGKIDTLMIKYQTISEAYKTRVITDKAAIIYQNSLITPGNIIDTNEQIVNDLFLAQLMEDNYLFDVTQAADLLSVADQCPREGGSIVYKARALYRMVYDSLWDDSACKDTFMLVRSNKHNSINNDGFTFAPVPAKDELFLEIGSINNSNPITIEIFDMTGRMVYQEIIKTPILGKINIPLKVHLAGIFTGVVKRDKDLLFKQKLVFTEK